MFIAEGITGLTVLVLAIVYHVAGAEHFAQTCDRLSKDIERRSILRSPKEVLEIVKRPSWLGRASEGRKMLIRSLEAVTNDEECSGASLDYLHLIGECHSIRTTEKFSAPSKAYARKCLTPEYVNQRIKNAIADNKVDFLNQTFIKKVLEQNPMFKLGLTTPSHIVASSSSAIVDAINRDFAMKDEESRDTPAQSGLRFTVWIYLNNNLFRPCNRYVESVEPFMQKLGYAATVFDGETEKLVETLNQESKDAIFRYVYCSDAHFNSHIIQRFVEQRLVQ